MIDPKNPPPSWGAAIEDIVAAADRQLARTQTDFLGRMHEAICEFERICEDHPEGPWPDDEIETANEVLVDLAALALGQLILVRLLEVRVGGAQDPLAL